MADREGYLKMRSFLFGRRRQYHTVFNRESPAVNDVLADLARFCKAHESTFDPDPRLSAIKQGRHEVWLRIQQHLNLSEEELWQLYHGKE